MVTTRRWLALTGLLLVTAAAAILLWPLHAPGLRGTALRPRYSQFTVAVARFSPGSPTLAELGIAIPARTVDHRREAVAVLGVPGVLLAVSARFRRRRPPQTLPSKPPRPSL